MATSKAKRSALDESNPLSYIPDGRSAQRDYYKLENRERQLKAIDGLTAEERAFVLGNVEASDRLADAAGESGDLRTIKQALNKIHEKDLIELRALVYLQRLPDTSPELAQLKIMSGMNSREQIAEFIADKQIKKLYQSQLEAITGGDALKQVYKTTIVRGPDTFRSLWS